MRDQAVHLAFKDHGSHGAVPPVTRDDQNETRTGDETDTHQDRNSSGTGLGSDSVNVDFYDWVKGIDQNPTTWQDELLEPDDLEWPGDENCGVSCNGCDRKSLCVARGLRRGRMLGRFAMFLILSGSLSPSLAQRRL